MFGFSSIVSFLIGKGFSVGLTTLPSKKQLVQEQTNLPRDRVFGKSTGKRKKDFFFGTWNVRTLYKSGAVHNIVNEVEKYKVKLTALQEIRWTNTGTININETTIFYGSCTEQRQLGTGFSVHKDLVPAVEEFKDINSRMSVLTIEAQWFDISFVNVHAPTEDKSQDEKEAFYEQLESALNLIPSNRIQIVLGDLNAKLGKEEMFRQVTGGHSLHDETNDNGTKLIDFAIGNGLVIRNHILVNSRFKNCIQDVRSIRGADSGSDHYLIRGKMKIKLKKRPHTRMEQLTRKGFKKQEKLLKNCDGMLITDPNDILDKWKDYFENLLNCNEPIDTFNWTDVEPNKSEYLPPSRIEIGEQIKRLKNHKTPGEVGIQAEILKNVDEEATSNIHNLVELVWKEEKIPEDWRTVLVCPIYKKNDPLEYFEKAYNSIHRPTLFKILKEFNMPKKLINLIKATMENSEIKIKKANFTSKPFKVTSGLRQGDALSPILFNLVLERVVRDMNISEGVTLGQSKISLLAYADDIAILGDNIEIVKIHCKKLMDAANKVGLRINDKKTEYMKLNRKDRMYRHGESMNVDGHIFQRVPQFKYLGVLLTQDNELKVEISKRMQLANNCYFGTQEWRIRTNEELQNLFQRPCISNAIKKRRLLWAGHAWRKKDAMINTVIREEPKGKRPLGRPRLRWEDCVRKDVKEVDPGANWREIAENRINWREICFA
ncbi:hypothetical protein QTP88_019213 [Uroleucon formosanum]